MKFCPNCGHELEEGAKFCPSCGAQLTTESDKVSEKSPVEQPKVAAETTVNGDASRSENSYEEHRESQNNQANQQQLGFVGSVQYVVKHAFEFNGDAPESRKSVFWWAYLAYCLVVLILAFVPALGANC
jgi:Predicted membrane protein